MRCEGTLAVALGKTRRNLDGPRGPSVTPSGTSPDDSGPAVGVSLHRPRSLLEWRQTDSRIYVGGDYQITLVAPYTWEIRHRGEHVEFNDSREWSFRTAEEHHREVLRTQDLRLFGGVALASAFGLLGVWNLPRGGGFWVLALAVLWVVCASALTEFLHTLAWFGRLRGGARYATPFGRATFLALERQSPT